MAQFKKQHYLPSAYLKYFSADQTKCNRDSWVWRFDGKTQRPVPVVSQCAGDYLFSKENAAETERAFQKSENSYCRCVDKIRANKQLDGRELGDLILVAFDFHLRNAIHKNRTGKEGIEAYNLRAGIFFREILLGRKDANITKEDIVAHVLKYWHIKIISISTENQFITSDHPSLWTTFKHSIEGSRPSLDLITLPLTPKHVAVVSDTRAVEIIGDKTGKGDEATLNIGQIENARECIFSSGRMSDEQIVILAEHFARKTEAPCETDQIGWKLILQQLPPEHHFSFMRLRPPLF